MRTVSWILGTVALCCAAVYGQLIVPDIPMEHLEVLASMTPEHHNPQSTLIPSTLSTHIRQHSLAWDYPELPRIPLEAFWAVAEADLAISSSDVATPGMTSIASGTTTAPTPTFYSYWYRARRSPQDLPELPTTPAGALWHMDPTRIAVPTPESSVSILNATPTSSTRQIHTSTLVAHHDWKRYQVIQAPAPTTSPVRPPPPDGRFSSEKCWSCSPYGRSEKGNRGGQRWVCCDW